MEFSGGIPPLRENSSLQKTGAWVSATPSRPQKTIRPRSQPRPQLLQSNSAGITLHAGASSVSVPAGDMQLNPAAAYADGASEHTDWNAEMVAQATVSSLDPCMEALKNASVAKLRTKQWARMMSNRDAAAAMLEQKQKERKAASLRTAISNMQNDSSCSTHQQQSNLGANIFCRNQALSQSSSASCNNTAFYQPQMVQYGFPVTYHSAYNTSPSVKTLADVVTNGTVSFQQVPVMEDRSQRVLPSQTIKGTGLSVSERSSLRNSNVVNEGCPAMDPVVDPYAYQGRLEPMNPPSFNGPSTQGTNCSSRAGTQGDLLTSKLASVKKNQNQDKGIDHGVSYQVEATGLYYNGKLIHGSDNAADFPLSDYVPSLSRESTDFINSEVLFHPINMFSPPASVQNIEINSCSLKEGRGENLQVAAECESLMELQPDKGNDHCIDLNKALKQKRKKIRPKVIREDKPKRGPKSATPNETCNKENKKGKRKYTRRAPTEKLITPGSAQEAFSSYRKKSVGSCKRHLDFNAISTEEHGISSAIHVYQYAPDGSAGGSSDSPSCSKASNLDVQAQCRGQYQEISHTSGSKSTSKVAQGLEAIWQEEFNFNNSMSNRQDEKFFLPRNATSIKTIASLDPAMESMKTVPMKSMGSTGSCISIDHSGYARIDHSIQGNNTACRINPTSSASNYPNIEESLFQNQLIVGKQSNMNSGSHPLIGDYQNVKSGPHLLIAESRHARAVKGNHFPCREFLPSASNLYATHSSMGTHKRKIQQYQCIGNVERQDINIPVIQKRLRTDILNHENGANHLASQNSYLNSFSTLDTVEGIVESSNGTGNTFSSLTGTNNSEVPNILSEVMSFLNAQKRINLNEPLVPMRSIGDMESMSKESSNRAAEMENSAAFTERSIKLSHESPASIKPAVTYNFCKTQAIEETISGEGNPKEKAKEGENKLLHFVHPAYVINQAFSQEHKPPVNTQHQSFIKSRASSDKPFRQIAASSGDHQMRSSRAVSISFIQDTHNSSQTQCLLRAKSPSKISERNIDPLDEIVQRFTGLNISSSNNITPAQIERILVPYKEEQKVIIPYEGPFDPIKKRKPRPKVDLDPETDRVWRLLMWKEGSDSTEERDAEKQKWWEEERKVFRGRADSFIARMHLVQGDRRFSPWKGSVVDSVVGVFLTQNVSDQLSSSAFMALAAKFPLQPPQNGDKDSTFAKQLDVPIIQSDNFVEKTNITTQKTGDKGFMTEEVDPFDGKEIASCNESFGSSVGVCTPHSKNNIHLASFHCDSNICPETSVNIADSAFVMERNACLMGSEENKAKEYLVSSQASMVSSQSSTESVVQPSDTIGSCSESNYETENLFSHVEGNDFSSDLFAGLQEMEEINMLREFFMNESYFAPSAAKLFNSQLEFDDNGRKISANGLECQINAGPANSTNSSHQPVAGLEYKDILDDSFNDSHLSISPRLGTELDTVDASREENISPSSTSEITSIKDDNITVERTNPTTEYLLELPNASTTLNGDSYVPEDVHKVVSSPTPAAKSYLPLDVAESSSLVGNQTLDERKIAEQNVAGEVYSSKSMTTETKTDKKGKKGLSKIDKREEVDWDSLRKQVRPNASMKERSSDTMDSADWDAVRRADVNEIAQTIRERGMSNMLSARIKDFLDRLVREHGSIDLEWLRDVPPDNVKDYLLSFKGLGLKSVECVRLLTLHHLAFPVDTNVGRICVRLGWVPLQPLPESLQLHLLELYPLLETIQKYLWPRLCTLDQRTLYELHYQMITFGKVFCTKHKPNCNSCPMRGECKHFASAFASARLALPGPEEKRLAVPVVHTNTKQEHKPTFNLVTLPPPEQSFLKETGSEIIQCEPIVEEPATPEPESAEALESAIEDAFWTDDPDEIPTIKLNIEEFTHNVQNYIQEKGELQDGDMAKALVVLTQEAASIPMPKLKNISRLRTEHQVYELPDSHPLLGELDRRLLDDPCPYLLAIWTPGETVQSVNPPEISCSSQMSGNLCSKNTCFACNSIREENSQTVRGTLLIPCRTAMRGSFPLNGTYFQVNEVFADHASSMQPIDVPRAWLWNLPRRTVYFGTSISSIFKGLTTEEIQQCFWRGFVCVRGFDQESRAPRPLIARLHFPASKLVATKKATVGSEEGSQKTK